MKIDTILERGKFIRKCSNPEKLAYFKENEASVKEAFRKFRFEWVLGRDGKPLNVEMKEWVIRGSRGHCFEYGRGKLGFSVEGDSQGLVNNVAKETKGFSKPSQLGDSEANFVCDWTPENVAKLSGVLKFNVRRR